MAAGLGLYTGVVLLDASMILSIDRIRTASAQGKDIATFMRSEEEIELVIKTSV